MTADDTPREVATGAAEGLLSLAGLALLMISWTTSARTSELGAQCLLAALGWRCGRQWLVREPSAAVAGRSDGTHVAGVVLTVAASMLVQLLLAEHSGGLREIAVWNASAAPEESLFGQLWVVGAALMLTAIAALSQRIVESITSAWRPAMAAVAFAIAGLSFGGWLTASGSSTGELLGLVTSSWGFAGALAVALMATVRNPSGWARAGRELFGTPGRWSLVPLTTAHRRPARWLLGSLLWGWPAVYLFVGPGESGSGGLSVPVALAASAVGGWVVAAVGGWQVFSAALSPATRRALGVSVTAAVVLVGTSTAVSAGGVMGGPAQRADAAGLLRVAVPDLEVVVPRPLEVLLVGDSTLAPMRWFREGRASLSGFDYVLDAESCRRIAKRSCWGRESRIPTSATLAINSRKRDFDYVVLMAGAHSTRRDLASEIVMAQQAAEDHGAKLLIVTLRESEQYVEADAPAGESAFVEFNKIIRRVAGDLGGDRVALLDWNAFSVGNPQWFRSDGIHPNLTGTIALGWFLSQGIAAEAGNPCPSDWMYPCPVPGPESGNRDWLAEFGVTPTEEHCYEDGNDRVPICQRDRRM